MTQSYTDPMTEDYWRRVRAALEFLDGIPTEELEGRKLREMVRVIAEQTPVEPEFAAILYRDRSEMYLREQSEPPKETTQQRNAG